MRLEFDAGSPRELTAVAALIAVLRAGNDYRTAATASFTAVLSASDLPDQAAPEIPGQPDIRQPSPTPPAPPVEPQPDPAAAFDAPSPEAAFAATGNAATGAAAPSGGDGAGVASPTPIPPVPTPPPASSSSSPPAGVEVDKEGLPWDARIHSTPATITKTSGLWRAKRGLDDATKATVTEELRRVMGAPAPAPTPATPPAPPAIPTSATGAPPATTAAEAAERVQAHFGQPTAPLADAPAAPPAPVPAPPPSTPAPPAPPPTPVAADTASGPAAATTAASAPVASFADLMRKITGMQTAGTLTVEGTKQISESLGITGVRDLMHRPDLIPAFDALLPGAA